MSDLLKKNIDETQYGALQHGEQEFGRSGGVKISRSAKYHIKDKKTGRIVATHSNALDAVRARHKLGNTMTHAIVKEETEVHESGSYVNGPRSDSEPRWKQTSMSHKEAMVKHGKENVRRTPKGQRNGEDMIEVKVPIRSEEVEMNEGSFAELEKHADTKLTGYTKKKSKSDTVTAISYKHPKSSHEFLLTHDSSDPQWAGWHHKTKGGSSSGNDPVGQVKKRIKPLTEEDMSMNKNESVLDLINAIDSGKSVDIETSFETVMASKVVTALENKCSEVANNLFTEESWKVETPWRKKTMTPEQARGRVTNLSDKARKAPVMKDAEEKKKNKERDDSDFK